MEAPVATSTIAPSYIVSIYEAQYFSFEFADAKLIAGTAESSTLGGLNVKIVENTLPGTLSDSELVYPEVGLAKLVIFADGTTLESELAATNSTETGSEESSSSLEAYLTVEVSDLSQGGLTSTFTINFKFTSEVLSESGSNGETSLTDG